MVYGAGGAIATRVVSGFATGFVPGALSGSPFTEPVVQAAVAVTVVRWAGKKFLGQQQGDIMMLGGLISAGLSAADKFLPNIQGQLTGIIRAPVQVAPQAQIPMVGQGQPVAQLAGFADVEDIGSYQAAGFGAFGDVEDVDTGAFNMY